MQRINKLSLKSTHINRYKSLFDIQKLILNNGKRRVSHGRHYNKIKPSILYSTTHQYKSLSTSSKTDAIITAPVFNGNEINNNLDSYNDENVSQNILQQRIKLRKEYLIQMNNDDNDNKDDNNNKDDKKDDINDDDDGKDDDIDDECDDEDERLGLFL